MTRAHLATMALAAGLALATAPAAMPNDGPHGDGQAYCPSPRPAPRPVHHRRGVCPSRARVAEGHGWRRHARYGGAERAYSREDVGVSASQARVYRRELAEHGLNGRGGERREYGGRPGWDRDHGDRDAERSGGHYRYERREFSDRGGYVEGSRDGHRYGWSWGGEGDRDNDRDGGYGQRPGWRDGQGGGYEVYRYSGRDEDGYLVWPGKPR